jgi:truncated hemoglobin YjbI
VAGNEHEIDLFEAMGGSAACRALSVEFYGRVAKDAILRPLFPGKSFRCAIEEFSAFLTQILGGPPEETQKRWWLSLHESHERFRIGPAEREAWMRNMKQALAATKMSEMSDDMRSMLAELFETGSAYVVNSGAPVPAGAEIHGQIRSRWEEQLALDAAVAGIRTGVLVNSPRLQACFARNRSVFAHFVGLLASSSYPALQDHALQELAANPDLAIETYAARTLLHTAASAGNLTAVQWLLAAGVNADVKDQGGHTPLYWLGNGCEGGAEVVRALVRGGANVNACEGVKRCTPLHMAARRGFVAVAEALIECGANIEARDSLGDTPLRRAVNCRRPGVAALLLERGANRHSIGSEGLRGT